MVAWMTTKSLRFCESKQFDLGHTPRLRALRVASLLCLSQRQRLFGAVQACAGRPGAAALSPLQGATPAARRSRFRGILGKDTGSPTHMDLSTFLIQCLNALQYGLLLFLVASGLTLIFGIMGVINLAHGSFYMIGAYMAYALAPIVGSTFGGGFFATLAVGLVLAVLLGYVLEWAFFSFLYVRVLL